MEEVHRCHRQASAVVIRELIVPRLQQYDGRIMRPKDIIADMKEMFGIQVLYNKAHSALEYALGLTYGNSANSYQWLAPYCYVLEQANPGIITHLHIDDHDRFLYYFMALGGCIRGFVTCMRPVIAVDGTHLKGRFKGMMFVAATQDGNEQIYPIAIGYGDSENINAWV